MFRRSTVAIVALSVLAMAAPARSRDTLGHDIAQTGRAAGHTVLHAGRATAHVAGHAASATGRSLGRMWRRRHRH